MHNYNMYNSRHFARVDRITLPAALAFAATMHRESVASMQAFGKMRTRGNSRSV
jgi:hypothetical protein